MIIINTTDIYVKQNQAAMKKNYRDEKEIVSSGFKRKAFNVLNFVL